MKRLVYTALLATALSVAATGANADHMAKKDGPHHKMTHHHMMMHNDAKDVQGLQQSLRDSGYYKGPVTGKWDDSTANALASYQSSKGLKPTGTLDDVTAKRLGLHAIAREKVSGTKGDSTPMPRHTMKHKHHTIAHKEASKDKESMEVKK